jgi:hypothetical protein
MQHELRPFDFYVDYKQTVIDLRQNREPSQSSHRYKDPSQLAEISKVVSASPYRATVKLDAEKTIASDSDHDDDFERDTMSHRDVSRRESPIKDDSEVLRTERDNYLSSFTNQRKPSHQLLTNRSERIPQLDSNLIRSIMNNEQQFGK